MKRLTAIKNVSMNEPHFQGHFPDFPVMPGVLIIEALAQACGAAYVEMANDGQCTSAISKAQQMASDGRTVLVNVHIDYSKRTCFTDGVVKATLQRFTPRDKLRVVGRALWRRITG